MRKIVFAGILLAVLFSCNHKSEKSIVTERIQYDVNIKSPDPGLDWWVQNLEGQNREKFIHQIIDAAYEGKVKAWDIFGKQLTMEQVKAIENYSDTILVQNPEPPYNDSLIPVKHELNRKDITRIRFLEEWSINPTTLQMDKKILGIAPLLEKYTEKGELQGYMPLFWVYFDEKYPLK